MSTLIDSFDSRDSSTQLFATEDISVGQSFTGIVTTLISCKFNVAKSGSPTGNIYAKLYAHAGVFGTTSIPTGPALAISDPISIASLQAEDVEDGPVFSLKEFTFSGANQYSLLAIKYVIQIVFNGGSDGTSLLVGTGSGASGNFSASENESNWASLDYVDVCFYVYGGTAISASSRGSKIVAWENRVQPFSITTCTICGKGIEKNPYQYLYCSSCRLPSKPVDKLPFPIEEKTSWVQPELPRNPNPPHITHVKFEKDRPIFSKKKNY